MRGLAYCPLSRESGHFEPRLPMAVSRNFRGRHIGRKAFRCIAARSVVGASATASMARPICIVRARAVAWIAVDRFLDNPLPDVGIGKRPECGR